MKILELTPELVSRWNAFVEQAADGTFFHLAEWSEIIASSFGHSTHFLCSEDKGEITGVLPLVHVKSRLFGNSLISTPFCVYGGIVAADDKAASALQSAASELADKLGVDYLELRNRTPDKSGWPTKDLYVTFRKEIDPDPEKNMLNIPRKQRAMVRKGIQADLVCSIDEGVERFYDIYSRSVHGLGTPVFAKRYFERLKTTFGSRCEILVIEKDGVPISTVMSFYFRDEVLPYYGGGTDAARNLKAYDFMYWDVMRRAAEAGIRVFDYGRSKVDTGSYSFKKHWGFEAEPLHYAYYLVKSKEMPNLSPANPKYKLFIEGWKRLPLPVTRILGPILAKDLG